MDECLKAMLQLHKGNLELQHLKKKIEYSAKHHCLYFVSMETSVLMMRQINSELQLDRGSVKTIPPGFYPVSFRSRLELKVFLLWI